MMWSYDEALGDGYKMLKGYFRISILRPVDTGVDETLSFCVSKHLNFRQYLYLGLINVPNILPPPLSNAKRIFRYQLAHH